MGEMLGGAKGMLVNFVVRNVKKMVPAFSLPNAVRFKDVLSQGARMTFTPVEATPTTSPSCSTPAAPPACRRAPR